MRDGSGNEWFCVFGEEGAFLKGFDHESPMSPWAVNPKQIWPGVLDQVPQDFKRFTVEPAFSMENATFCIWRSHTDDKWHKGKIEFPSGYDDPDGSADLLSLLDGEPEQYKSWAESYYERSVPVELVEHIYRHRKLTDEIILGLNPECDVDALSADIAEIGYPE